MRIRSLVLLLALPLTTAAAQRVGLYAVTTEIAPDLFGSRPLGIALSLERPLAKTAVRWHLSVEGLLGSHPYDGPCSVFNPPPCRVQPYRASSHMASFVIGAQLPVLHSDRASLSVSSDLGAVQAAASTQTFGFPERSISQLMYRLELGLAGRWQPVRKSAFAIDAGYAIGSVRPFSQSNNLDGFSPFDSPLATRRAWLGLVFGIGHATNWDHH